MTDEIYKQFVELASGLSPENLSRDGEATQKEIETEYHRLIKEWSSLELKAGRKVTEDEIWNKYYDDLIANINCGVRV